MEDWSNIISAGSATVAVCISVFTLYRDHQRQKETEAAKRVANTRAERLETKAETAQKEAAERATRLENLERKDDARAEQLLKLSFANSEVQAQSAIDAAWRELHVLSLRFADHSPSGDAAQIYAKVMVATRQRILNVYDAYCQAYIDGKIDKIRFRKAQQRNINRLVEKPDEFPELQEAGTQYSALLLVYKEWQGNP